MTFNKQRVAIFVIAGNDASELLTLISTLDCVVVVPTIGEAGVIVIYGSEPLDAELTATVEAFAARGKRLIGVYAHDSRGLPKVIDDFASSVVPLDADRLHAVICREETAWCDPNGHPRPYPNTPRRCR